MNRSIQLAALLALAVHAAAQTPPPQTTPIRRGSGWAEPWQARWQLTPMLEVNLATGNLVCAISTGRFYREGLPPHHEVTLVHNAQRANVCGDFTGGFDLGDGWSSNLGVTLSFPSSTEAELVLGDGNVIGFEDDAGTWTCEAGQRLTLEPEGSGWVVTDKRRWKVHLDSAGKLDSIESSEGNEYVVTWGAHGVDEALEPSGRGSTFDYDGSGRLDTVDFPAGTYWSLTYDGSGRLASVTNADYGTVSMTYDSSGRIETFTDYDSYTWEFEYWGHPWPDRLKTITFPDATEASLAYSGLVNRVITTVADQRGNLWKSVHDVAESPALQATIDPFSKIAVYAFDAEKQLASFENELGHEWTYAYDAQGNLESVTDPLLRVTSYVHDSLDRLKEVELDGETTYAFYADTDHPHLPTSVIEPRDDANVAATTAFDYFGPSAGPTAGAWNGRLDEMTDAEGVSTRFDFDGLGLFDAEHEGPATANGRIDAVFDGLLGPTFVDHGGMEYPTTFPALPPWPSEIQGDLLWSVAPGGEWDWRGQYAAQSFDVSVPIDTGSGWETSNVTRTFGRDHLGRLTSFDEVSEETTAHVQSPPSTPPTRSLDLVYDDDAADGAIVLELPSGESWIWRRDAAGRVTTVSVDDGSTEATVATRAWYDDGSLQSTTYANGASALYTYEDNGLVASIEHLAGTTSLLLIEYAYDARNLPIEVTETTAAGTLVKEYDYDQRRRITHESRDDGTTLEERSYAYDQVGNRIEREVRVGGVLTETTLYHYDREDVATYLSDNNRLVWSETLDGSSTLLSTTWHFYENPFGNVSRIVTQAAGTTAFDSIAFRYTQYGLLWLFWSESWDDVGAGPVNVARGDVIEVRADRPLPRLWRKRDGSTLAPIGTDEWTTGLGWLGAAYSVNATNGAQSDGLVHLPWLGRGDASGFTAELFDRLGSVRRSTDGSSVVAQDYRAFGEALSSTGEPYGFGGALGARQGFGGVSFGDGELVQTGWRVLAPSIGRFAMRDPSGTDDGPNVYAYVCNAPTSLVDPTGRFAAAPPQDWLGTDILKTAERPSDPTKGKNEQPPTTAPVKEQTAGTGGVGAPTPPRSPFPIVGECPGPPPKKSPFPIVGDCSGGDTVTTIDGDTTKNPLNR